ncbi:MULTISPECIES: tetratricopeptide repeat protein [unclassified Sphingomonas]|jgi:cellulose synthase operon protein C|nr:MULTISPECIES: tetratricopeptide repeat protein [unclassified Sphingomonas]
MTSNPRRPRSGSKGIGLRRLVVIGGALAVLLAVLIGWFTLTPGGMGKAEAAEATERAEALLKADNATGARDLAAQAVRGDPDNENAHIVLARALLALQDGIGAEGEIQRAVDAGYDARAVPQWRAEAWVLQGKTDKAPAEADKAPQALRPYGLRIRARALTGQGDYAGAHDALDAALHLAPNDAGTWTDIGRFRFIAGDILGAAEASDRAVKLAPGSIDALILRGEVVRSQYGLVAALPWFEQALKRDPARHDALIEYAATLGDIGRTVDALAATRRALAARPGSPQALYLQAVIAARAGNFDLARAILEKTGGAIDDLPGMMLLGGTLDLEKGDYEQAIEKLTDLVGTQPMNITARKLLAIALLRTDRARNAIDMLSPVVARSDADSYALTLAARGFERIGDRDSASHFLDRAAFPATGESTAFSADDSTATLAADAAKRPNDPGATLPLIRALIAGGDKAGALARAQDIAARNPGAAAAQVVLGDMLMLLNRPADAAAAYRHAADLRFDEPTLLRLVDALDRAGRREAAANALALFLSQNPASIAALRLSAHWQLAGGDYDAAIDSLEDIRARIGDGDAVLNAELAAAYAGAGETGTAVDFGEAAYGLAPANPAVADAYGWALFRGGDRDGALELLQKAVILAPRHPGLHWHLAQVYAALGRKAEAKRHAQAALADPAFADRAAAQAMANG